ncbi:MAG TPA: glycosyltransferase family 39 protein [Candidatus Acidoferrales bacterium]|nr:glycosyltransferase family 39 protein [Candidatus Acidoferrales bacterium]
MTTRYWRRLNVALAALSGVALRIFFVLRFPATGSGDTPFYLALAWNWLKNGIYGAPVDGRLVPLDARMPGYPAFLAAIFAFAGNSQRAVMFAQVAVDLATCFVIALIAARLAPGHSRRRAAIAALWLAALCPFTANYTAVLLTETLVTLLTALGLLLLLEAEAQSLALAANENSARTRALSPWFLAGIIGGFGALVRPETPLLLIAAGAVLVARWWRPVDWLRLARAGVLMAMGLLLPLAPWAARNWRSLHEIQFLSPRYANLPSELVPIGFNTWAHTWLWRYGDVYLTLWKLDDEPIPPETIPPQAYDSPQERARVAALLAAYNDELDYSAELDRGFAELARERTSRHPLRTYIEIPVLRSLAMWFTPRIELLPYSGQVFPLRSESDNDREDLFVTLGLGFVNFAYVALAIAGAWIVRRQPGVAMLIVFVVLRTAFFATVVETPEPRYVLECFPAVIAFAAQVFAGKNQLSSTGSG